MKHQPNNHQFPGQAYDGVLTITISSVPAVGGRTASNPLRHSDYSGRSVRCNVVTR